MRRILIANLIPLAWIAVLWGCGSNDASLPGADAGPAVPFEVVFESGFEEPEPFAPHGGPWDAPFTQAAPGSGEAVVQRVGDPVHAGSYAVKATAPPGAGGLNCGKASIGTRDLDIRIGDTVRYSAWLRLEQPLADAAPQLLDVECQECARGGPGVRVVTTRTGRLRIDWKFLNWYENEGHEFPEDAPPVPPDGTHVIEPGQWFRLTLQMTLGKGEAGLTQVYVNDELDSQVVGTNISPDGLEDLDHYPQIQVGVTCLPMRNTAAATVVVDDVVVERARGAP